MQNITRNPLGDLEADGSKRMSVCIEFYCLRIQTRRERRGKAERFIKGKKAEYFLTAVITPSEILHRTTELFN
jgi:hypothetical protein